MDEYEGIVCQREVDGFFGWVMSRKMYILPSAVKKLWPLLVKEHPLFGVIGNLCGY